MDYTDLAKVKSYMDSQESANAAAILPQFISAASRDLDKLCTSQPNVSDYFLQEDVVDEVLTNGVIDWMGRLTVFPHKPIVNSVVSLSYRFQLRDSYVVADTTLISVEQEMVVFEGQLPYSEKCYVKISYNGGLGLTTADLPLDLQDIAAVQAVRLFKEARSQLGDSIGVAELGTMVYTKAFPIRVIDTLQVGGYVRIAPWT
jgi:hypothetical protein